MCSYIWDSLYYLGKGAGRLRNIECEMKRTVEVILCDPQFKRVECPIYNGTLYTYI